jgi:hypothetical protein
MMQKHIMMSQLLCRGSAQKQRLHVQNEMLKVSMTGTFISADLNEELGSFVRHHYGVSYIEDLFFFDERVQIVERAFCQIWT